MQQNEPLYISDPPSKDLKYTAALIGYIFPLRRRNAWQRRSVSQAARRRGKILHDEGAGDTIVK